MRTAEGLFVVAVLLGGSQPAIAQDSDAEPAKIIHVPPEGKAFPLMLHSTLPTAVRFDTPFIWTQLDPWLQLDAKGERLIVRRSPERRHRGAPLLGRIVLETGGRTVTIRIVVVARETDADAYVRVKMLPSDAAP